MAKKNNIQHPDFGELQHVVGDLWQRDIEVDIFGKTFPIRLSISIDDKDGVEPLQVLAFKLYGEQGEQLLRDTESEILAYYCAVCDEYRGRMGVTNPNDNVVPLVSTTAEVATLVSPTELVFPYAVTKVTFGLLFNCTWEPEHGLGVRYEEGKITEVGFQDVVL